MDKNGWQDIGYNFCIGGDGLIYEGRGWQAMGAHTPGFNDKSLGICFLGDFTSVRPTLAARNNAQSLIRCGVASGRIDNDFWLYGHGVIDAVTLRPTVAARANAQALIRCGVASGSISTTYSLIGHSQVVAATCPGTALLDELRTWPRFNDAPTLEP
ncbi:unnamed protein product [Diamesa hyperborea]